MSTPLSFPASLYATVALKQCEVSLRALQNDDLTHLEWHGGADWRSFYHGLHELHETGQAHVIVADYNGFPVGMSAVHWRGKPTHPALPDVQSLRVHPFFRGLGIGSQLLHVGEVLARQTGHLAISLAVGLDNEAARRLYERLGYHVTGAPYCDVWYFSDATGHPVRVEENVLDMVKTL